MGKWTKKNVKNKVDLFFTFLHTYCIWSYMFCTMENLCCLWLEKFCWYFPMCAHTPICKFCYLHMLFIFIFYFDGALCGFGPLLLHLVFWWVQNPFQNSFFEIHDFGFMIQCSSSTRANLIEQNEHSDRCNDRSRCTCRCRLNRSTSSMHSQEYLYWD